MSTWRYRLAALLTVAAILLGGVGVLRANRPTESQPTSGPTPTVMMPSGPVTLEDAYASALGRARQWSSAPVPVFASLQTDWPLDADAAATSAMPPGGWGRFGFTDGTGERRTLLSVVVQRYTNQVERADEQPWTPSSETALPVAETRFSSSDALATAEEVIGQRFRTECPTSRHQTYVILIVASPGHGAATPAGAARPATPRPATPATTGEAPTTFAGGPTVSSSTPVAGMGAFDWLVTYRDDDFPGINAISMTIDAGTGDMVDLQENSIPCGAG